MPRTTHGREVWVNVARERATCGDVTWARMDTPHQPMVVTILLVLAEPLAEERLREILTRRLLPFARFRQQLVREGGRHVWIEDAAFDLNAHLERRRLPEPADQRALATLVGELASQPLDPNQPLWRCVVVENAGSGCALLFRVHHCIADGIALLRVFLTLADRAPRSDGKPAPEVSLEERREQARLAAKTAKAPKPLASGLERLCWGGALLAGLLRQLVVIPEPRTMLRGTLNGRKRMAWSAPIPLGDVARIRQRWGGRVNDVMLTVVTGALGRYLRARGETRPGLMARLVVPVNLRPYQEEIQLGNQFAVAFLKLPLTVVDPVARLAAVRARMERVKSSPEAMANLLLIRLVGGLPGWLERGLLRLLGLKATAVLTNVPGPEETLYLANAPVARVLAWVPQITSIGIGVCVLSYAGAITIGVTTDQGVVVAPEELVAGIEAEIAELLARVGLDAT
ncbi:MAG: wax ester/triacylglycerol synthase family O-acyltransferase [Candidatus Contendobacter sp.]|nr:wax ester/triacylglycerol synthase family O-acyltransferase [Candidatus Contendobacter sp.]MDS4058889.1 wax ester/triacylglycerol synthase family O-acyltransferase [Candidatus Contendobacter sp.]